MQQEPHHQPLNIKRQTEKTGHLTRRTRKNPGFLVGREPYPLGGVQKRID